MVPDDKPDEVDPDDVILDKYLCDINLVVDDDGLGAKPISAESMAYVYAGEFRVRRIRWIRQRRSRPLADPAEALGSVGTSGGGARLLRRIRQRRSSPSLAGHGIALRVFATLSLSSYSRVYVHLFSGAKSTWGVTSGKICFEVKLMEIVNCPQATSAGRTSEINLNDFRVGFSAAKSNNQLGEDKHSYAITMAGKKCTQKYFEVRRSQLPCRLPCPYSFVS